MEKVKWYEFEGEVIKVPIYWDDHLQREVEDYEDYYNGPVYTPAGRPILLTIEDACPQADMVDDDPASIDCGSCRHYHQFPGSLLGYAITRSGERRNGAPAGAAQTQEPRRKHYAKTIDSSAFVPVLAVYAAPGHGLCRGGAGQRPTTGSPERPMRTPPKQ